MKYSDFILFKTEDDKISVDVRFEDETVWLSQEQMASLFGKARTTITEHIQNIFKEGELREELVCRNFRLTTQHGAIEGKSQDISVKHYNLDVIISVGYRVKSLRGNTDKKESKMKMTKKLNKDKPICHAVAYPGSRNDYNTVNLAIHPDFVNKNMYLKEIYCLKFIYPPCPDNDTVFFQIYKNGIIDNNLIYWNQPISQEDMKLK